MKSIVLALCFLSSVAANAAQYNCVAPAIQMLPDRSRVDVPFDHYRLHLSVDEQSGAAKLTPLDTFARDPNVTVPGLYITPVVYRQEAGAEKVLTYAWNGFSGQPLGRLLLRGVPGQYRIVRFDMPAFVVRKCVTHASTSCKLATLDIETLRFLGMVDADCTLVP